MKRRPSFGISIAPAGDVNGDGWPDLLIAAPFHSTDGGRIANGGAVYLVYGGFLQQFHCTVKIRVQEIGKAIPASSWRVETTGACTPGGPTSSIPATSPVTGSRAGGRCL